MAPAFFFAAIARILTEREDFVEFMSIFYESFFCAFCGKCCIISVKGSKS